MARAPLGLLLGHLRPALASLLPNTLTDAELLQRFATAREEAAFATLMQRHGPLVLGVCRRLLHQEHDAEDAFQATFLVLARRAGAIGNREAVSGWLYRVASRIAWKMKRDTARRDAVERRAAVRVPADALAEISGRELLAALDQALQQLPAIYRTPLVLCYLEGLTQEEAARQLGWPRGTLKGRLERGRELLHRELARRGLTLSATLLASVLSRQAAAAALPAGLAAATLRGAALFAAGQATEAVSPHAAAVAEAVLKTMLAAKLKAAAALLVVLGALAVGVGLAVPQRPQEKPPAGAPAGPANPPARATATAETDTDPNLPALRVTVAGTVVDANGNPVPDADVWLREGPVSWSEDISPTLRNWHPTKTNNLAGTSSDALGQFVFQDVVVGKPDGHRRPDCWLDVIALAKGHGLAWEHLLHPDPVRRLRLRLSPESSLRGRVTGPDGKPIAGARVQVLEIAQLHQLPVSDTTSAGYIDLQYVQRPLDARTDADGRFVLTGLPRDVRAMLRLSAERFLPQEVYAATTDTPQPRLPNNPQLGVRGAGLDGTVHTGALALRLQPGHRLLGRVVFADTGKPAAGARFSDRVLPPRQAADAQGRFSIDQTTRAAAFGTRWTPRQARP